MIKKTYKKIPLLVSLLTLFLIPLASISPVFADDPKPEDNGSLYFDGRDGKECTPFLGLTPWDCGVNISDQDSLQQGAGIIAVNILTDINIIAAYLVLGYTIYGGYLYVFSAGDPTKANNGKKTLSQAFIGLAIVISAFAIMSTIRYALLKDAQMSSCATSECINTPIIVNAVQWAIGFSGVVALIFVIYGGIMYTTSASDPNRLQKAKQMITYALIGLAIAGLAEIITAFVSSKIREAQPSTSTIIETINQKELYEKKII